MKSKTMLDPTQNYNRRNSPYFIQTVGKSPAENATALRKVLNVNYLDECILKIGLEAYKAQEANKKLA